MKKIVTHINPDLDAIAGVWLIKRFLPGWQQAEIDFVQVGAVENVDQNPDVLFVDLGQGKLDHHQTGQYLSAAQLCFNYLKDRRKEKKLSLLEAKALKKIVDVVTEIDNARDLSWPEVAKGRYQFYLQALIGGLKGLAKTDEETAEFGFQALESILLNLKNQIRADEELKEGREFSTCWGKAVGVESGNRHVLWQGEAQGYVLVVKKDEETGGVQIYARYDKGVDLTNAYHQVKKLDPKSDWFLHASKKLLLSRASVNPEMRPTKLSLKKIIEILQSDEEGGVLNGDHSQKRSG